MSLIQIKNVYKQFLMGETVVEALRGVDVTFTEGEYTAIMGPSGSGKSTLMNILGCLDVPSKGQYLFDGLDVSDLSDDELSDIRGTRIGFIFQSFNLIGQLSVLENIEVSMFYQGHTEKQCRERAVYLAEKVGLGHRMHHHPRELSGGEQQRVAIARALSNDPRLILADEPTGNLDSKNGAEILEILDGLHGEGKTILMVTHDPEMIEITQRVVRFKDGMLQSIDAGGKK